MSLGLTNASTFDQVARAIVVETGRRGYGRDESIAVLSTAIQESGLRMVWHSNGRWHGYFQQDSSYPDRLDPNGNILGFLDRLDQKRSSAGASPDIWLNIFWLQQRPSDPSAQTAFDRGRKAYLDEIKRHVDQAARLYDHHTGGTVGFTGDPLWLEEVLKAKIGDRLVVHKDWQLYGTGAGPGGQMGNIWGVMMHHTGNANEKPETIRKGVHQAGGGFLRGPLSQCLITPDGKCHLVAVGPCNHAGAGSYPGLGTNTGNVRTIGIECAWPTIRTDGSYDPAERWPDAQIITMREVAAAIVARLGYGAERVIGHKEYAGASQGKWDPGNLDMDWFRGEVAKDLRGEFTKPTPPPPPPTAQEPPKLGLPRLPFDTERDLLEEILRQQRGPYLKGWAQLGDKTVVDSLADLHRKIDRIAAALDVDLSEAP